MIDEQVKENNQDKVFQVLTKIHVPGEESLCYSICTSFLSGMLVCAHMCVKKYIPVLL